MKVIKNWGLKLKLEEIFYSPYTPCLAGNEVDRNTESALQLIRSGELKNGMGPGPTEQ